MKRFYNGLKVIKVKKIAETNNRKKEIKLANNLGKIKVSTNSLKAKANLQSLHKRQGDDSLEVYSPSDLLASGKMRKDLSFADDKRDYSLIKETTREICIFCKGIQTKPKTKNIDGSFRFIREIGYEKETLHNIPLEMLEKLIENNSFQLDSNLQRLSDDKLSIITFIKEREVVKTSSLIEHFEEIDFCCNQFESYHKNLSLQRNKKSVKRFFRMIRNERLKKFGLPIKRKITKGKRSLTRLERELEKQNIRFDYIKSNVKTFKEKEKQRLQGELSMLFDKLKSSTSKKYIDYFNFRIQKTIESLSNL